MPEQTRPRLTTRISRRVALVLGPVLIAAGVLIPAAPAAAAFVVACGDIHGPSGLVGTMDLANRTTGVATVQLAAGCTYVVDEPAWDYVNHTSTKIFYDSAFWPINDRSSHAHLVVEGNGATITLAPSAGRIRFFDIDYRGEVTLKNLTLTGGQSPHGRPDGYQNTSSPGAAGGAILNGGRLTLVNVTLRGNNTGNGENGDNGGSGNGDAAGDGGRGGAVYNSGTLTISGSTITNNVSGQGGNGGNAAINGGQGGSGGDGGAIYNSGTLSISTSLIAANGTGWAGGAGSGLYGGPPGYRGSGGAIAGTGTVTVSRSLVKDNLADGMIAAEGGAINMTGGTLNIDNSTFVGNKAWRGGALHVSGGNATIRNATFTGNDATGTGDQITGDVAAMDRGATMQFANTLMYQNDPGQVDCNTHVWGPAVSYGSLGGLLSDENSGCGTNTVVADPKLEALGDWGGPTQTRALKSDSPAQGVGVAAYCGGVDQRGVPRPATGCDAGAFERVASPTAGAISGPVIVSQNQAKTYTSTASAPGSTIEYRWSVAGVPATISSASAASPQITFTGTGIATVNLNVRVAGATDSESINLTGLTVKVPPAGNTAPQVTWSGAAPTAANEGDTKRFTFSVTDPQGDTWVVSSGFPSCGGAGTVTGSSVTASGGYVDCLFPNGPASSTVTVQVEDVWSSTASITSVVAVAEVAPSITVTGASTGAEGSVVGYSFTIIEPGTDVIVPVTSCTGAGTTKVSGSDSYEPGAHAGTGVFQCRLGNGPGAASASVTANGGSGSTTTTITNVAPTISVTGPNPADENGAALSSHRYELNSVDPGDKANLTLVAGSASCGGAGVGTVVSADATAVVCRFANGPGSAVVTATLRDQDGATSTGGGLTVSLRNVAPVVTVAQPSGSLTEGSTGYYALTATDSGIDTLTVTAPAGCTANFVDTSTPGRLTATIACLFADGPATVSPVVTVSDGTTTTSATILNQVIVNAAPNVSAGFTHWDTWEGQEANYRVSGLTDAGQDTPTSIIVHWGDGSQDSYAWPLATTELKHRYFNDGEFFATVDVVDGDGTHTDRGGSSRMVVHNSAPSLYVTVPHDLYEGVALRIEYQVGLGATETYEITDLTCGHDERYVYYGATNVVQNARSGSFDCTWGVGERAQEIRLRVTDSGGISSEVRIPVWVTNRPPVVVWTDVPDGPFFEDPGTVHRFEYHASDNGQLGLYALQFTNGNSPAFGCGAGGVTQGWGFNAGTGDGFIDCTFPSGPATPQIYVDITDWQAETFARYDVTVLNAPPTVELTASSASVVEGEPAVFTYTTSDPSGEQVTTEDVSCGTHGTVESEGEGTFSCRFDDGPADRVATVTVSDGTELDSDSASIHVTDAAPTGLVLTGSPFFEPGQPYELTIGDTIDAGADTASSWVVHWGDTAVSTLTSRDSPATHVYQVQGTFEITVDVADEDGEYLALGTKSVREVDHVAPVLTIPDDTTMEGNGSYGLYWTWPRSAIDDRDGELPIYCTGAQYYDDYNFFYVGQTRFDCWATDAAGNKSQDSFIVTVTDTTPPSFGSLPTGRFNATGPDGRVMNWSLTATDAVSWRVDGFCLPAPGQLFGMGVHNVHCEATDGAGNLGEADFSFEIGDFDGPTITVPPQTDADTIDATGAVVTYPQPTSWDTLDGAVPVSCTPASGSHFPLHHTTVDCTATDSSGNISHASLYVWVRDMAGPVVPKPVDRVVSPTNAAGVTVTWANPVAVDNVDGDLATDCYERTEYKHSGDTFGLGTWTIDCVARDAWGNWGAASYTITVKDIEAPDVNAPDDVVVEATAAAGQEVDYSGESADDVVDGSLPASCLPASGSVFPIGVTTVTCSAIDSQANVGTDTFTVSVLDRTLPVVTAPDDLTIEATGPSGTAGTFAGAVAYDSIDGVLPVICAPPSGSSFGFGDTTVTCSATDSHGNIGTDSFVVTVVDTTDPVLHPVDLRVGGESDLGSHVDFQVLATDEVDGEFLADCDWVSGDLFPVDTTKTVECTATDLHGNVGEASFTVEVYGALLTEDEAAGSTEGEVSRDIFEIGDYVVIDEGGPDEEVRLVEDLGSIIIAPLAFAHPAGTIVSVIGAAPGNDTTAPQIAFTQPGPVARGSVLNVPVSCTDAGVGVQACIVPPLPTLSLGDHVVTIRAWDRNGNPSSAELRYQVVAPGTAGLAYTGGGVGSGGSIAVLLLLAGLCLLAYRRWSTRDVW